MREYSERTIQYYDSIATEYFRGSAAVVMTEQINKYIDALPVDATVLDLACGPGHDAVYMSDKGVKVVGVDLSKKMIAIAQNLAPQISFSIMDFFNIGFKKNTFDGVWASSAIVHTKREDLPAFLKEVRGVLKQSGLLGIISAEMIENNNPIASTNPNDPRQYSMYGLKETQKYLQAGGFEILEASSFKYGGINNDKDRIFILAKKVSHE